MAAKADNKSAADVTERPSHICARFQCVQRILISKVVLAAQGFKCRSCTPALLDVKALGDIAVGYCDDYEAPEC